jgi:pimeloyl-ACP methyl ester carboxylesterase
VTVRIKRKFQVLTVTFLIFAGVLLLMDSCMQFRMSKSEIDQFFSNKEKKGTLHEYSVRNGRTINYLHVGDANLPLVIFVHGSPGSLSAFIHFMTDTALLKRAQLITVDRAGFGESNFGYAEKSLQRQAEYLLPILEKYRNNKPIILVGHSLGGPVIARMAMDYQSLVDGLVIVAGSIDPELEPHETWFRAPLATPFLSWIMPRSFRASNLEIYKLKPGLQEMLPLWKNITCNVTIIQGMKDDLVSPANTDFAKKMLVNASSVEYIIKDDMSHFVPWQHPELIREAIIQILSKK